MEPDPTFNRIAARDLAQQMATENKPTLVDTLSDDHFRQVHLPGAQNACVFQVTFLDRMTELVPDKDTAIVVYGSRAETRDAESAAGKLLRAGYPRVAVLEGGLAAWHAAGYPLEGTAPADLAASPHAPVIEKRRYTVDTANSIVQWVGRNPNTHHTGSLRLSEGFMDAQEEAVRGRFVLDLASIENTSLSGDPNQSVLIAHLLSDDFFWAERFPTATFHLERLDPIAGGHLTTPNTTLSGALEMMGVRAPLQFPATLTTLPDKRLAAEAHFDIDRTRWNIIYGSSRFFDHLGMHVVFDLITVQLKLVSL
jgi:rhodanese-related sulfurtransferase